MRTFFSNATGEPPTVQVRSANSSGFLNRIFRQLGSKAIQGGATSISIRERSRQIPGF
jgi:hypothetical protein